MSSVAVCADAITPLGETGNVRFDHLSDQELLTNTRQLVGATNQILAELLTHLAEVEKRGVHRARLCTSLYTYCVYELRFSEDAAYRRVSAARLVQRFPQLYEAVASGELHLTGLLMLGPHLTAENVEKVLPFAKHRTKKELAQLVRQLDPLPEVPAGIVPLGPAPLARPRSPTYAEYARSLNPVNHLPAGDRPRDWMSDAPLSVVTSAPDRTADANRATEPTHAALSAETAATAPARFAPLGLQPLLAPIEAPQRYHVRFTAGQEYADLVEKAQALLSHSSQNGLVELHLQAMRALVAKLEKRKYANRAADDERAAETETRMAAESHTKARGSARDSAVNGRDRPRQRGRHVPAAVRRAVEKRDGQRCAYTDEDGRRCPETHRLEFHHILAFGFGGPASLENISLRCRCHNLLAAEEDFGRKEMQEARERQPHESLARQAADRG